MVKTEEESLTGQTKVVCFSCEPVSGPVTLVRTVAEVESGPPGVYVWSFWEDFNRETQDDLLEIPGVILIRGWPGEPD